MTRDDVLIAAVGVGWTESELEAFASTLFHRRLSELTPAELGWIRKYVAIFYPGDRLRATDPVGRIKGMEASMQLMQDFLDLESEETS